MLTFHLSHVAKNGQETGIGTVKLLQRTSADDKPMTVAKRTELPRSFSELESSFVSLGQDDDYYKKLHELMGDQAGEVLDALRDIAWHPAFASDFELEVMSSSLFHAQTSAFR